jgi:hypothetical protein
MAVVKAERASRVNDSMVIQMRLNLTGPDSPYSYYDGDEGWIENWYAPLAAWGIKRVRTSFGPALDNSQTTKIIRKLNAEYGTKFDLTLNAELSDRVSSLVLIDRAATFFPQAVRSFQGLNEPNSPNDPDFKLWKDRVIDHTYECGRLIRSLPAFANVPFISFSGWARQQKTPLQLLFANGISGTPYRTASGRTWIEHCRDLVEYLNDHWYTGGRRPTIAGNTSSSNDENGADDEITLDQNMTFMDLLKPGARHCMTENGWQSISNSKVTRQAGPQYLSENARAKYYQRQIFENLLRNYEHTVAFELFDNPYDLTKIYGFLDWKIVDGELQVSGRRVYDTYMATAKCMFDGMTTADTFEPGSMRYEISVADGVPLRHKLFQKSNGRFVLAMWLDVDSWNREKPFGDFVQGANVNVLFERKMAQLRVVRPYLSSSYAVVGNEMKNYETRVCDDVMLLEVTR